MNLKGTLVRIATVVADEAVRNPDFYARLEEVLSGMKASTVRSSSAAGIPPAGREAESGYGDSEKRRRGRRAPAVLDPIALAVHGEAELREQLSDLDLELLHDIVAQYGMDPGKLVMKWRDRDRIIDRVVEVAMGRATKGDAFRKE